MYILLTVLIAVLVYAWILYPVLLAVIGRVWKRARCLTGKGTGFPVAVLVAAYNEESVIKARLENLLSVLGQNSCAGHSRWLVFLGVDGASDRTGAIAQEFAAKHENIHVCVFDRRRGKVAVLKDLAAKSREMIGCPHIQVFTDANSMFRPDAVLTLLPHFEDQAVGGVCGRLVFRAVGAAGSTAAPSENVYWQWETRLKRLESDVDSCLGANGAIYALRSELFWRDIPDNVIVDDFVIGMKVRESGARMVFEPAAIAEEFCPCEKAEWSRRVRIGAGDYQALWLCRQCLLPRYRRFAFIFLSHKVLRWFTPHLAVLAVLVAAGLVAASGVHMRNWLPLAVLAGMVILFIFAGAGRVMAGSGGIAGRFARLCNHFVMMNAALLAGSVRFMAGDLKGYWDRTPRQ